MSTASNSRPAPTRRRVPFVPTVRGDLAEALASPEAFAVVAPAVPRSVGWLRDRSIAHADGVTARDYALLETLLALTTTGTETEASIRSARVVGVERALSVMSIGGSPAQPRELVAALGRLFGRPPEPLKRNDVFTFHHPAWTVPAQQLGTRYAYLDLAVLARFRRRSSPLLYREILAHLAAGKVRYEPGAAPLRLSYEPAQLAAILGMPEPAHVGQLRLRYLNPAVEEIRAHVRAFEILDVSDVREGRRRAGEPGVNEDGREREARAVAAIVLTVRLRPPARMETARARAIDEGDFAFLRERGDAAPYAIRPETLVRLGSVLPSNLVGRKKRGGASPLLTSEMQSRHLLWLAAIHEALTGRAITPAAETAPLRGARLLDAIARDGADKVFWAFSLAEAEVPDLAPALADRPRLRLEIEAARKARAGAARQEAAKARRRALRDARADGTMAPPVQKRESTNSPGVSVTAPAPEPTPVPQAAPIEQAALDEARAILATLEARKEAEALSWHWQLSMDFPFAHAAAMAKRFLDTDFAERFPRLHEADRLLGHAYRRNVTLLGRVFGLTKETASAERFEAAPYVDEDLAVDAVLTLAKGFALSVANGQLDAIPEREAASRDRIRGLGDKARLAWREREEARRRADAQRQAEERSREAAWRNVGSGNALVQFPSDVPQSIGPVRKNAFGHYEAAEE